MIRCEEKAAERAYLALGRYYYHNLRDAGNTVTEPHCIDIEAAEQRIDAAGRSSRRFAAREGEEEIEEITLDDVREYRAAARSRRDRAGGACRRGREAAPAEPGCGASGDREGAGAGGEGRK